jgi:hypothetical protein
MIEEIAKPGDSPIEQPRLVINLKAAQAIGATIPQSFLVGADRANRMKLPCPLLMLWTAHPPARECHESGCIGLQSVFLLWNLGYPVGNVFVLGPHQGL